MSRFGNDLCQVKLREKIIKLISFIGGNSFRPPAQALKSAVKKIRFLIRFVPMEIFNILNEIKIFSAIRFMYWISVKNSKKYFLPTKVKLAAIHISNAKSCLHLRGKDSLSLVNKELHVHEAVQVQEMYKVLKG